MAVPNPQYRNYDTDQFTDPVTGYTVHDDGTDTYTSPFNGITYTKIRTLNGQYVDERGSSFRTYAITLAAPPVPTIPFNAYVTEDGITPYAAEDGTTIYVQEN